VWPTTVYGIVKQHEGMVHLYSEPNEGTTVRVYLPVADGKADDLPVSGGIRTQGGSETILVAEDDESLYELIPRILESRGYRVLSARDGREAYDQIRELHPELPVLFSSGYNVNAIHTEFVLHEGLQLPKKPFSADQLLDKVLEILDR